MTPSGTLLGAVAHLHSEGLESIRVRPYVYALGTWRFELFFGDPLGQGAGESFFAYSSAARWDYFADFDQETTVDGLASRLRKRVPDLAVAEQPSPGYRFWFHALVDRCGDHAVPYFFAEYEDCVARGYVGILSDHSGISADGRFPLPPAR